MSNDEQTDENFGCAVLNPAPCEDKATIAITGLGRSGTTMVARILRELGIPMGDGLGGRFLEDTDILRAIKSADMATFKAICRARDARHSKWAFKCPAMRVTLQDSLKHMRGPRLIVPFRDIMAISMRNNLEISTEMKTALGLAARGYAKMLAAFEEVEVPILFMSYEKTLQYPVRVVKQIAEFCGMTLSDEAAERIASATILNGDPRYFGSGPAETPRGRRILLIGNSHAQMIRKALDGNDNIQVHWLKGSPKARFGEIDIEEAEAKIAELRKNDLLILMHLGTMHNLIGLLNHEQPFTVSRGDSGSAGDGGGDGVDGVDGAAPPDPVSGQAEVIPETALRATFQSIAESDRVVARLAAAAKCETLHVMPPPPKENLDHLATGDKAYRGKTIAEHGFAPAPTRLALWQLEEETLRNWLAGQGIGTLAIPDETRTPEGYLHPDFAAPDATHANSAYGAKLIERILALP